MAQQEAERAKFIVRSSCGPPSAVVSHGGSCAGGKSGAGQEERHHSGGGCASLARGVHASCAEAARLRSGEAKSAQLLGEAIQNNPAFLTLRKIEAAREIASTVAASGNRVLLSADSLLLNLKDLEVDLSKKK